MLLSFSAANHLSIRDEQTLSLVASSLKDSPAGLIECRASPAGKALPAVVIYGANASGKSNLVDAICYMRMAVLSSRSRWGSPPASGRRPFALDRSCIDTPSRFSADFVIDQILYHYGFEESDDAYVAEWLYTFPKGRRQILFERKGQDFKFGRELRGRNKIIADLTRQDSLFLSAATANDHAQISKFASFFHTIHDVDAQTLFYESYFDVSSRKELDSRIIHFLRNIGTGVVSYRIVNTGDESYSEVMSVNKFSQSKKLTLFALGDRIALGHLNSDNKHIYFDIDMESSGTKRLLILLDYVFSVLDNGGILVIDELDASLHTQACEAILSLFCSPETNPNGAQLIATTHDTNLLRSPLLRRDQIWFTEKDDGGATHLYPLTDIRTRKGDDIERGYLQGRFGAIPFSGPIPRIVAAD